MSKIADIESIMESWFKDNNKFFEEAEASMKIDVDYQKCQVVQYKFDKKLGKEFKGGLFPFFAKKAGVCKICDYVIFAERKNRLYCVLVELKKGKSQSLPQLDAGECFAKFINLTYNRVYKRQENIVVRKVSIKEILLKKKKTKMKPLIFDENNHCLYDLNRFYIIACLD